MASVSDTTYGSIRETTSGVTPGNPAFTNFDTNSFELNLESNFITSEMMKANRAAGDSIATGFYCSGNFTADFHRNTALEQWIESGFGGLFDEDGVLKAGALDSTQTLEQRMVGKGNAPMFFRSTNSLATSVGITVDATAKAEFSADFMGLAYSNSTAMLAGASYVPAVKGPLIAGGTVGSIDIEGLNATFYSLDLTVAHTRSPKFGLFNHNAFGITTGANRQTTLTLTLYRDDLSAESVFRPNVPVAVNFTLGGVGEGYTFALPRCFTTGPRRETNDNSELVTVELIAADDLTLGTDVQISKS